MADIYKANQAFAFTGKSGVPRVFAPGTEISSDDPDFKGKEHLFERVGAGLDRARRVLSGDRGAVETATAEPGEKRTRSRRTTTRKTDDDTKGEGDGQQQQEAD